MAVTIKTGTLSTDKILSALQKPEVLDKVILAEAHVAPMYALLRNRLKKQVALQPEFSHFEDQLAPTWTTVAADATATDTTISVAAGTGYYFRAGDVVLVPSTGEQMLVTSVASDSITVTRGYGATSAAAISSGAYLLNTGPSKQEGAEADNASYTEPTQVSNYIQEFSELLAFTDIQRASETYGGPEEKRQINKKRWEILRSIEYRFLFGEPKLDTSVSPPRRLTGGLSYFVTTNVADYSSSFDEDKWNEWLEGVFSLEGGSPKKTIFCGGKLIRNLMSVLQSNYTVRTEVAKGTWGLKIVSYTSPFGEVELIHHKLLKNDYSSYGFAVDFEYLQYRYMKGMDLRLIDIQTENPHVKKYEYHAAVGLDVLNEKAMGIIITPA